MLSPTQGGCDLLGFEQVNVETYRIHTLAFMHVEFVFKLCQKIKVAWYRNKNCNIIMVIWQDVV